MFVVVGSVPEQADHSPRFRNFGIQSHDHALGLVVLADLPLEPVTEPHCYIGALVIARHGSMNEESYPSLFFPVYVEVVSGDDPCTRILTYHSTNSASRNRLSEFRDDHVVVSRSKTTASARQTWPLNPSTGVHH